jgi:hypothetical protein
MGEDAELEMLAQQESFQGTDRSRDSQKSWRQLVDVETLEGEMHMINNQAAMGTNRM